MFVCYNRSEVKKGAHEQTSELESSLHKIESETMFFCHGQLINRTTSRFDARLEFKHTQNPDFLISNARLYSRFYGICFREDLENTPL